MTVQVFNIRLEREFRWQEKSVFATHLSTLRPPLARVCKVVLAISMLQLFPAGWSSAMSYSVSGTFYYEVQDPQRMEKPLVNDFELRFINCSWRRSIVQRGNTNFDAFVFTFDGVNLLYYALPSSAQFTNGSGTIEESPVPHAWTTAAGEFPWLAFASGCYFGELTNNMILSFHPLQNGNGFFRRYEVPGRFNMSTLPP